VAAHETAAPPAALEVLGLTGPAGARILFDVTLRVPAGETHVVLGPIHSGKSMLLRHLVGLERATEGTLAVGGERFDARAPSDDDLARLRRRVGAVFEGSALFSRMSVVENVELPLLEHTDASPRAAREAARELLAEVGLRPDDDVTPADLGRADKRRVALARALALRPPVVVLDEPTVGLDAHSAAELDDALERTQARRGFGALILTHEVRHAFGRARRIDVMAQGRLVAGGDRAALLASEHPVVKQLLHRRDRAPAGPPAPATGAA
jgi:phospholipid/cholesterol/gamma-HCH transport system ATP-binding protein